MDKGWVEVGGWVGGLDNVGGLNKGLVGWIRGGLRWVGGWVG